MKARSDKNIFYCDGYVYMAPEERQSNYNNHHRRREDPDTLIEYYIFDPFKRTFVGSINLTKQKSYGTTNGRIFDLWRSGYELYYL
jgi:hypothetical protein